MKFKAYFIFGLILFFASCHSNKSFTSRTKSLALESRVTKLVNCLNNKSTSCLQAIYANDFKSISPTLKNSAKKDIIDRTIQGFSDNQLEVGVKILEIHTGKNLGYVVMDWQIYEQAASEKRELLLEQKRMDIWQLNGKLGWQLKRSVFYEPKSF